MTRIGLEEGKVMFRFPSAVRKFSLLECIHIGSGSRLPVLGCDQTNFVNSSQHDKRLLIVLKHFRVKTFNAANYNKTECTTANRNTCYRVLRSGACPRSGEGLTAVLHPPISEFQILRWCRQNDIRSFIQFTFQPKLATEFGWRPVYQNFEK